MYSCEIDGNADAKSKNIMAPFVEGEAAAAKVAEGSIMVAK